MNWNTVGDAVKEYAPLVGMALSSPVGAVAAVGKVVANIFGTNANPEDVLKFIENDPQKAAEKLQYEISHNIEFQKLCLQGKQEDNRHEEQIMAITASDKDSARKNSPNINQSPVDNWIKVILTISEILLLAACIAGFFVYHKELDQGATMTLGTIIGLLINSLMSKDGFYWGSSFGSKMKDDFFMKK